MATKSLFENFVIEFEISRTEVKFYTCDEFFLNKCCNFRDNVPSKNVNLKIFFFFSLI